MKRTNGIIVFVIMAVLVASAGAVADGTVVGGKPSAFFPELSYEFAPVPEGTVLQHDYPVRNRGTSDLEIRSVKTG